MPGNEASWQAIPWHSVSFRDAETERQFPGQSWETQDGWQLCAWSLTLSSAELGHNILYIFNDTPHVVPTIIYNYIAQSTASESSALSMARMRACGGGTEVIPKIINPRRAARSGGYYSCPERACVRACVCQFVVFCHHAHLDPEI